MKKNYTKFIWKKTLIFQMVLFASLLGSLNKTYSQQTNLSCSNPTNLIAPSFIGLSITASTATGASGSAWANTANSIDANTLNSASLTLVSSRVAGVFGCATSTVTNATSTLRISDGSYTYNRGNYVGVVTSNLSDFSSITLSINNDATVLQSSSAPTIIDIGGGLYQVGFLTTGTGTFNSIQIVVTLNAPPALNCGTNTKVLQVYYPFQIQYCALQSCNIDENASLPNFNVSVSSGGLFVNTPENVISPSTSDGGSFGTIGFSVGERWIGVTDNATMHPSGTFAGFEIESTSIIGASALNNFSIELRNGPTIVGTASGSALAFGGSFMSSSGKKLVGLVATAPFNHVRIIENGAAIGLSETKVYNAVFKRFCEGEALTCNTPVVLTSPEYPITVSSANSGIAGAGVSVNNNEFLIDNIPDNSASINLPASFGVSGSLSVKKELSDFPAGTYAGFEIETPGLGGMSVSSGVTISTYKDGDTVESFSSANLFSMSASSLTGGGRQKLGFITTMDFDEVQITVSNTGIEFATTLVYGAIVQTFCSGPELTCNEPTILQAGPAQHPVVINGQRTGITSAGCAGCTISNTELILDNNPNTNATVVLAAGFAIDATVSVANAIDDYPIGTYIGFDIGTPSLVSGDLFGDFTLTIYRDGVLKQQKTVPSEIISATSDIATGTGRQTLGLVADSSFDEIQLTISKPFAGNFGSINIYSVIIQKNCSVPVDCSDIHLLNAPAFPVAVESPHTGIDGAACAGCTVLNPNNLVNADLNDFALIEIIAGSSAPASISVKNGADNYPVGAYAGFTIEDANTVFQGDFFQTITINTYKDGEFVEAVSGANLLNFDFGIPIFGNGGGIYNVGFVATQEFDEMQFSIGSMAGRLNMIRVYSAFVDIRGTCPKFRISADFNTTIPGEAITGNASTNDIVPAGITRTYGAAVAKSSNPTTTTPVVTADGSYTFSETAKGVYKFTIPVCFDGGTAPCSESELAITVIDLNSTDNTPILVPYTAVTVGAPENPSPVTINMQTNNVSANPGAALGDPTIITGPANGIATIDPSGNLIYTPNNGFIGIDTVTYQVCEPEGSANCATNNIYITVLTPGSTVGPVVTDDIIIAQGEASGNVANNDINPGTVTFGSTSVPGKGSLTFDASGNYTFTPEPAFSGPVSFIYNNCSGDPEECASGTLYVLMNENLVAPVTLIDFTAINSGNKVQLNWTTTMETNSSHFIVERSIAGGPFTPITKVNTRGIAASYTATDNDPSNGLIRYRLKIVDIDGAFEYSPVRFVDIQVTASFRVFPNPLTAGNLYLTTGNHSGNISIRLTDLTGRILRQSKTAVTPGSVLPVNTDGLVNQLIFISVLNEKGERLLYNKILLRR